MKFYLMLALTLVLAACGGNNAANAHKDDHDHNGHGHGDEHGEVHAMGEKDLGDGYKVKAGHAEGGGAGELMFEIQVLKDGKPQKDAQVTVWMGDKEGKELSPVGKGEWMADEELFDCHVREPKDENAMMWVRVKHADKEMKASFDMPKEH